SRSVIRLLRMLRRWSVGGHTVGLIMAELTLTANEVADYVPGTTARTVDITDAANLINELTGYTPTEHGDDPTDGVRLVPNGMVKRAWAIVAARLAYLTAESISGGVVAESDVESGFTISPDELNRVRNDPLTGQPRQLLRISAGVWSHI
ncbi:MAG: hypothetical protein WBM50_21645, partial [Acidimicrobiales bacterium]